MNELEQKVKENAENHMHLLDEVQELKNKYKQLNMWQGVLFAMVSLAFIDIILTSF